MTDPIATLRTIAAEHPAACEMYARAGYDFRAALAELERRARIEARLKGWLKQRPYRNEISVRLGGGKRFIIELRDHVRGLVGVGKDPDYHTALEAALNAAGAP